MAQLEASRILYSDERCIVVDKKAGEAMEGATGKVVDLPVLLAELYGAGENRMGKPFPPTAVHRLDVPVTGCALFARTTEALAKLNADFASGRARKVYWAIVEASDRRVEQGEAAELVHWIRVDGTHNKSYAHDAESEGSKQGLLRYRVAGSGDRYHFLEIELITGRHHQIRAQLAAVGFRIKGDLKYGAKRSEAGGGIRLHARSLAFPDPAWVAEAAAAGTANAGTATPTYIQTVAPVPLKDALWAAFEACAGV